MGSGVTHEDAEVNEQALEFGATTSDEFDELAFPDFEYIWKNRSDWSQRYNSLFWNTPTI